MKKLFLVSIFLFLFVFSYSQKKEKVQITCLSYYYAQYCGGQEIDLTGYTNRTKKPCKNETLMVFKEGKKIREINTDAKGGFKLELEEGIYEIRLAESSKLIPKACKAGPSNYLKCDKAKKNVTFIFEIPTAECCNGHFLYD